MKCQRCGHDLLSVVELSVEMGGPQICGACIDSSVQTTQQNCSHSAVATYPNGSTICLDCGQVFKQAESIP